MFFYSVCQTVKLVLSCHQDKTFWLHVQLRLSLFLVACTVILMKKNMYWHIVRSTERPVFCISENMLTIRVNKEISSTCWDVTNCGV